MYFSTSTSTISLIVSNPVRIASTSYGVLSVLVVSISITWRLPSDREFMAKASYRQSKL